MMRGTAVDTTTLRVGSSLSRENEGVHVPIYCKDCMLALPGARRSSADTHSRRRAREKERGGNRLTKLFPSQKVDATVDSGPCRTMTILTYLDA